jgi:hypothetical protein
MHWESSSDRSRIAKGLLQHIYGFANLERDAIRTRDPDLATRFGKPRYGMFFYPANR